MLIEQRTKYTPVSRGLGEKEQSAKQAEKKWLVKQRENQEKLMPQELSEENVQEGGRGQLCQMLLRGWVS